MYENMSYELILSRMLDRVNEWARQRGLTLDTREGSLIRTALSPAAAEMMLMYFELEMILNESFADTQTREFLIRRCAERGIIVEQATNAIRQGEFNMDVPIGARFSLNSLNYVAVEKISDGVFKMECETPGNVGNLESGALIPIDYIAGLETAQLTAVLIPGEDEEETEHLRNRYFNSLDAQAYGGNVQDYKEKTLALPGVGGVKVYPVWNGGGTVKLVILDTQYNKPSDVLVDEVQTAIDPTQNNGEGVGIAPIGHVVTVAPVGETTVNIRSSFSYRAGWSWDAVKPYVEQAIDTYFTDLAREWADSDTLIVRISQIETRLLGVTGILDVQDTFLNDLPQNMTLDPNDIPIRGGVSDG